MNKIKLGQLEMLIAAVDAGSFSAAAIEMDCTQSRVSHAIAELEQSLGVRLLLRSRAGCIPTDTGYQVLAKARQIMQLADNILNTSQEDNNVVGHVRIACFRSAGAHLLPHALEALARDYPGIQVDVNDSCSDYEEVIQAVEQGAADIGITRSDEHSRFLSYRLVHDFYVCVVPASSRLSTPLDWEQLSDMPFIHAHNPSARYIFDQCRATGFNPKKSRKSISDSGVLAVVSRGVGFTIFPQLAAFPATKEIKIIPLPFVAKRHISLIVQPEAVQSKALKIAIKLIREKRIIKMTDAFRAGIIHFD